MPNSNDPLYTNPDLVQFYDIQNGWSADFDFCAQMAQGAGSVLDLGCGTGELLAALASGRRAVGVDPASAMLDVARNRDGGDQVEWIQADAKTLNLTARFDLIVLTSHSFQVFLTDDDQRAVLRTIARHLAPTGRFVFDSRNPAHKAWERWNTQDNKTLINHPRLGKVQTWNNASYDAPTQVVTYHTNYQPLSTMNPVTAASKIRFTEKHDLAARIDKAGLQVDRWLGDWNGAPYTKAAPEIIPVGHLR